MLTAMMYACVMYVGDIQHCDVRVSPMVSANAAELPYAVVERVCSEEALAASLRVAKSGLEEEGVQYITYNHGACLNDREVKVFMDTLDNYMQNFRKANYTLTIYYDGKQVAQSYHELENGNAY